MKRNIGIIKTIATITTLSILMCGSYLFGTAQAKSTPDTKDTDKVVETIPSNYIDTTTEDFYNNYVDISTVTSYCGTANGLQLYTADNNGYYLDIEQTQDSMTQIYYNNTLDDLETIETALENRNGKIIIEIINGTVIDNMGNGKDSNGYYIKYDADRFIEGDRVQSMIVYNPDNNSIDDILYRVDVLVQ